MAQDPEEETGGGEGLDTSHDLDMVTLYESSTVDSEAEAEVIRGLLESVGIPASIVSGGPVPPVGFIVRVPRNRLEEAQRAVEEAEAEGPEGAAEAEASTEETK
jgi:hypothetical protein